MKHTPETLGRTQRYDFTATIISSRIDSRIGAIHYLTVDVPIPRYFGDGKTLVHTSDMPPLEILPCTHSSTEPAE